MECGTLTVLEPGDGDGGDGGNGDGGGGPSSRRNRLLLGTSLVTLGIGAAAWVSRNRP